MVQRKRSGKKKVSQSRLKVSRLGAIVELLEPWVSTATLLQKGESPQGACRLIVLGKLDGKLLESLVSRWPQWQQDQAMKSQELWLNGAGENGPESILMPWNYNEKESAHDGTLSKSEFALLRDSLGEWYKKVKRDGNRLVVEFYGTNSTMVQGALVGLEMAHYSFKTSQTDSEKELFLYRAKKNITRDEVQKAGKVGASVNLSRHLVNLPSRDLNPKTYGHSMAEIFKGHKGVKVTIWDEARLKREKMGLLLGVGQGAEEGPCLVHISYRPKGGAKKAPLAFVGKGITYDTGGLDLKPSLGMRLMKKDMGGSATVAGLAYWTVVNQGKVPCDFYLAIAENAVSGKAFYPGDILTARNGKTVEIDNTDAEGRLALADALDVASTMKEKPRAIIDVATLTGAIKVGLGSEIAGLFANNDGLADKLQTSSQERGELLWRMPLFRKSFGALRSNVADFANSAGGFGGAIRAAVFLEKFVAPKTPWAHIDIYGWKDSPEGALLESGGNGQCVQTLIDYVDKCR